ncbi:MAG: hydrogenase [Candidatus Cloacimonetes bacterium]|nr:hydrogenase [Candidatus Cloacimonadota bacterium]MCK9332048.1 hydrogenase [Candidatus Cloacimonadota bacterium]
MDPVIYQNLVDICAVSMLLLSVMAIASSRMTRLSQIFSIHSLLLAILAFIVAMYTGNNHIFIICALTFILKVITIPKFLNYMMDKINMEKEVEPLIGIPGSLLLSTALVLIAYLITEPMLDALSTMGRNCLAISLSIVFIGLLMMITRRKALTESIGLLLMENGLFLGAITISYGMPLIVEFGVFFDVIIAVVIIGIFAYRINRTFNSIDTSFLRRLKE